MKQINTSRQRHRPSLIVALLEAQLLNEKEGEIYRRGRNANSHTKAKNADIVTYRMSTGFEAVLGYLHMTNQFERLDVAYLFGVLKQ